MPKDPRILFGKRLAVLRKERGWSQEQLALESGLARSYLGGIERGQRNIALLNIVRLADTLGRKPAVSSGELLKQQFGPCLKWVAQQCSRSKNFWRDHSAPVAFRFARFLPGSFGYAELSPIYVPGPRDG